MVKRREVLRFMPVQDIPHDTLGIDCIKVHNSRDDTAKRQSPQEFSKVLYD
jgi:hypothetical protein